MALEEWIKPPESARNKPKLNLEQAQRITDEAIAGGQVWDVQKKDQHPPIPSRVRGRPGLRPHSLGTPRSSHRSH